MYRGGYSKLHTLCLHHSNDLESIIAGQPLLRCLGVLYDFPDETICQIKRVYQNLSCRHTMPPTFTLVFMQYDGPMLGMWPSFHRPGEALQVCRDIEKSFTKIWTMRSKPKIWRLIFSFCLLGISEENINLLSEAIEAAVVCFKNYCLNSIRIVVCDTTLQVRSPLSQCQRSSIP